MNRDELLQLRQQIAQQTDSLAPVSGSRISDAWAAAWNHALANHCHRLRTSVHRIFVSGRQTALATAVSADGLLITKASEVKGRSFAVELATNKTTAGELVAIDETLDLALIRVVDQPLLPIDLKNKASQGAKGTLFAAVGNSSEPTGFGVLSSANRPLNGLH